MKLTPTERTSGEFLSHRLEVKRIWLDKFLFAIIVALIIGAFGFAGKIYFENYKADITKQRFLLEHRLAGLKSIRSAYSCISRNMIDCIDADSNRKKEIYPIYRKKIKGFTDVCNEWNMMFSETFDRILRQHLWIHEAIAKNLVDLNRDHWPFIAEIFNDFDRLTRIGLWEETFGSKQGRFNGKFILVEISTEEMKKIGPHGYFNRNFENWQKKRSIAK